MRGKLFQTFFAGFDSENKFIGWNGQTNLSTEKYLSSFAYLKNIDNIKSYFEDSDSNINKVTFKKARINLEKGSCYEAMVDKNVIEKYNWLKINISSPENIDIFMIDKNQFNGIEYNGDSFTGDKFLFGIGDI